MPNYTYRCTDCDHSEDYLVVYEDRRTLRLCECGGWMEYVFPIEAAIGFQNFESGYDEGLGCDIHGRRHQKQVMESQGVVQAGDSVRGGRNIADTAIGKVALQGVNYSDRQRSDANAYDQKENTLVTMTHGNGREVPTRHGDNKTNMKKSLKTKIKNRVKSD